MKQTALLVGNSDGIGLGMTKRLLSAGWHVRGISRSDSSVRDAGYQHRVADVRFGFVDTKMAKPDVKPLMMSVDKAVDHLETCILKKPMRYSAPKIAIPLIKLRRLMMALGLA